MSFPNATTLNAFIFVSLFRNMRFMIFWEKIKQTQNEIKWCTQKYHNKFFEAFSEGPIIKHKPLNFWRVVVHISWHYSDIYQQSLIYHYFYIRGRYNSGYDSPSVWKFLFSKYFGQSWLQMVLDIVKQLFEKKNFGSAP